MIGNLSVERFFPFESSPLPGEAKFKWTQIGMKDAGKKKLPIAEELY
jgi:hypothetical protein